MQLTIESKGLELTDAIRTYVEEKFGSLELFADIVKLDVDCGKESGHHRHGDVYVCEAHLFVAGKDFFVKKEEEDLYKAIDKVKDHLKEMLAEWKDRHISEQRRAKEEEVSEE
jgi:ribosomal subunit interface protein